MTDLLVACHSTIPDEDTQQEIPVNGALVEKDMIEDNQIMSKVTDNNKDNVNFIYICDSNADTLDVKDYCVENGELVKQYQLKLECDAVDEDMDGIPDIEGDGITLANFTLKVTDLDTEAVVSGFSGTVKITTQRGKILGGQTGRITITSGIGSFQLRSVPESVDKVMVKAFLTMDGIGPSMRAKPDTFLISFK
jgi:hypothetical protein